VLIRSWNWKRNKFMELPWNSRCRSSSVFTC